MKIYIDIIYVINCILGCFCILSLSILTGKIISIKKCIVLSLIWGIHVVTLYTVEWFYYFWVYVIVFLFEKKHIIRKYFLFFIIHETYLNSLTGVYRIGNVLIVTDKMDWVLPVLIGLIIIFIYLCLLFQLRRDTMHQCLTYEVIAKIQGKEYFLSGFLDTGNQALYEGRPIVFLKKEIINMNCTCFIETFSNTKQFYVQKGQIYMNNQWIDCAFSILDNLEINEDCLLNYYLL